MDLKELITEGESFLMSVRRTSFGDYIADSKGYAEWGAKSLMFLQSLYPNHPQTERFFGSYETFCDVHMLLGVVHHDTDFLLGNGIF